jgi:hypothetical protein
MRRSHNMSTGTGNGCTDIMKERAVAKSAQWVNTDDYKFPDDYYTVRRLMNKYGDMAVLGLILCSFKPIGFKCPECKGTGIIQERYNAYPQGLPDSYWGEKWEYRDKECPVCKGSGAVPKKLKPKMVQDGWDNN